MSALEFLLKLGGLGLAIFIVGILLQSMASNGYYGLNCASLFGLMVPAFSVQMMPL